jgi:Na+/H+ antiporter NhaC
VASDLGVAPFLVASIHDISPVILPLVSFLIAGLVAFATGTSWGTMAILVPVCLPVAAAFVAGDPGAEILILLVGASVLDGAIFGDHCSVISDTTVMSSIATECDHVEHVRTQIPYALLAMFAAGSAGYLFLAFTRGAFLWLAYPLGILIMAGCLYGIGRKAES